MTMNQSGEVTLGRPARTPAAGSGVRPRIRLVPAFRWTEVLVLAAILAAAAVLNFLQISRAGYANTYYAAAVRSMLQNWHNFFFVSFDPGGFVSVDKPPLGFWIQTASAKLFGFHGWSILLPQGLAGVLSVLALFVIVRRAYGSVAALVASTALALTPVAVADNRNNTIDSLLVLALLLAAWATLRAAEQGRLRWLMLGMALVGLGFNIKMLEAYLVLPALVVLYFLGAPLRWRTRVLHLVVATVVLLVVSLSWVMAVDLTPAGQRPYVGSSQHNSELELAFGYNGVQRLLGMGRPRAQASDTADRPATQTGSTSRAGAATGSTTTNAGAAPTAAAPQPAADAPNFQPPQGGGPGFVEGGPSALRLFDQQLGGQAGWLLPLALTGLVGAALGTLQPARRLGRWLLHAHPSRRQRQLILWSVWLLAVAGFFSVANFFHPYYLITIAPAVAALAGIGIADLTGAIRGRSRRGWLLPVALLATAAVQMYLLQPYGDWGTRLTPVLAGLCLLGAAFATLAILRPQLSTRALGAGVALGILGVLVTPAVWSSLTIAQGSGMPSGGPAISRRSGRGFPGPGGPPPGGFGPGAELQSQSKLLAFLEANRGNTRFLVAMPSSMQASPIVIQTGQPVMAMGGFSGGDPILTGEQVARDVADGTVRFFLISGQRRASDGNGSGDVAASAQALPNDDAVAMPPFGQGGAPPPPSLAAGAGPTSTGFGAPAGGPPGPFGGNGAAEQWVAANCTPVPSGEWQNPSGTSSGFGLGGGQQLYDCAGAT